jgi:hypothetical protein
MEERKRFTSVAGNIYSPSCPDEAAVLWFIQKYGIFGLGGNDGCACCHFSLCGIDVDVSCRKSEHCVRVHCGYLGYKVSNLFAIANEVLAQLRDGGIGYRVRFCGYSADHVNGRWENGEWREEHKCVYCGKPRAGFDDYLCAVCAQNKEARHYDASGFMRNSAVGEPGGGDTP